MNNNYKRLITKLKNNDYIVNNRIKNVLQSKISDEKELNQTIKMFDNFIKDNNEIYIDKNNIIFREKFIKEDINIEVVTTKSNIPSMIEYDKKSRVDIKYKTLYNTRLIIVDEKNYIDNIMIKKDYDKKNAINYAKELKQKVEKQTLDEFINFVDNSLK